MTVDWSQAKSFHDAGTVTFNQYVRVLYHLEQQFSTVVGLEVDRHGAFASVCRCDVIGCAASRNSRAIDSNYICSHVGKEHSGQRSWTYAANLEHGDAGQRSWAGIGHRCSPRC